MEGYSTPAFCSRRKRAGQRRKVARTAIRARPSTPPTTPPTIGPTAGPPSLLAGEVVDVVGAVLVEDEETDVVI
jgi:hypothetical protein